MRTLIGAAVAALVLAFAPLAPAHEGNPGMRSEVTAITPATGGVTVTVLNYDDRLELHNTSGKPVVVEGYSGEPYARVLGDGTVEVNTNSEAYGHPVDRRRRPRRARPDRGPRRARRGAPEHRLEVPARGGGGRGLAAYPTAGLRFVRLP